MPKVVVTAQVEDLAKWEQGFRSHGDHFKSMTVHKPIGIAMNPDKVVAVCLEPDDLETFMKMMQTPANEEAMAHDGVKRETVKVFVLDKELKL